MGEEKDPRFLNSRGGPITAFELWERSGSRSPYSEWTPSPEERRYLDKAFKDTDKPEKPAPE